MNVGICSDSNVRRILVIPSERQTKSHIKECKEKLYEKTFMSKE